MKIDVQFGRPKNFNEHDCTYLIPFSIVGATRIPDVELIKVSQTGRMRTMEQQILAELCALLQVELYGRVLSNEITPTGNSSQPDSKASQASGGANNQSQQDEAAGSGRSVVKHDPTFAATQKETKTHQNPDTT